MYIINVDLAQIEDVHTPEKWFHKYWSYMYTSYCYFEKRFIRHL